MRLVAPVDHSDLDHCSWIVWDLEVRDPRQVAPEGVAERTKRPIADLASSLGCVLDACTDDDSYDLTPEGTYYSWLVRVPRREHERRDEQGIPVALSQLQQLLRTLLPAELVDWRVGPDRTFTLLDAAGDALREQYADLLEPFETALLPLRQDGAEELEPRVQTWAVDEPTSGTYALWLCSDPDPSGAAWLVLRVGLVATREFWVSSAGKGLSRFGVAQDSPVLMTAQPASPTWWASLDTSLFSKNARPESPAARGAGARHQWTSQDAGVLASRVLRDLRALFPKLGGPTSC
ncbi:hypothetical protein ACFVV7_26860 [Streptomyces globisporus]|uniref:hypothetical protein n=1 Tax=Streptomyces globisporus TaxID=1908 RepID=UPI0036D842FB